MPRVVLKKGFTERRSETPRALQMQTRSFSFISRQIACPWESRRSPYPLPCKNSVLLIVCFKSSFYARKLNFLTPRDARNTKFVILSLEEKLSAWFKTRDSKFNDDCLGGNIIRIEKSQDKLNFSIRCAKCKLMYYGCWCGVVVRIKVFLIGGA